MSDYNYPPGDFAGSHGITVENLLLVPPGDGSGFDDIFKNSAVISCTFDGIEVRSTQHRENSWDANNGCENNTYRNLTLRKGRGPAVYLKDGFCNNVIDGVTIVGVGTGHTDWYEGDYGDQGGKRNSNPAYNNVRGDNGPVRVSWTFFRARKPRFTNSNVRYQYVWSFVRTLYVELKYMFPRLIP